LLREFLAATTTVHDVVLLFSGVLRMGLAAMTDLAQSDPSLTTTALPEPYATPYRCPADIEMRLAK